MADIRTISNGELEISVKDAGAELCNMKDVASGKQLVWTADPLYWNRHAPLLFPIVGKLIGNRYTYEDTTYEMGGHGFARDSQFTCISAEGNEIWHRLTDNEATRKMYPFAFQLDVGHRIDGKKLICTWKITNTGDNDMLFSIGGHTAFCCPEGGIDNTRMQISPHLVIFKQVNSIGAVRPATRPLPQQDGWCKLDAHYFDDDVYIFEDAQLQSVALADEHKKPYLQVDFAGFPAIGIWAKPGAPFVCIEPWYGVADHDGCSGKLADKAGIQTLAAGACFVASYSVTDLL